MRRERSAMLLAIGVAACGRSGLLGEDAPDFDDAAAGEHAGGTGGDAAGSGGSAGSDSGTACADPDGDGDGYDRIECGGDDCDDRSASIHPGVDDDVEPTGQWIQETLAVGMKGQLPAIVIDSAGWLHIAYTGGDYCSSQTWYATNRGGTWQHEIAAEAAPDNLANPPRIRLSTSGEPMVLHSASCGPPLKLYKRKNGVWEIEDVGSHESDWELQLSGNTPHVIKAGYSGLSYLTLPNPGYQELVLDPDHADYVSLSLDAGQARVVYQGLSAVSGRSLRYVTGYQNGVLTHELVHSGPEAGWDASAAFGADGSVHVAHRICKNGCALGELHYALRENGVWTDREVDLDDAGTGIDVALESNGRVHIVYGKGGYFSGAYYALLDADDGHTLETLETQGEKSFPAIAVDSASVVHVLFHRSGELRYAVRYPDSGVDRDCDGAND